jgi:hypothetical protein
MEVSCQLHAPATLKVKSLCVTKHQTMKTYGVNGVHVQVSSALDGGEWKLDAPAALLSGKQVRDPVG